jgi:YD repeat-containing protein
MGLRAADPKGASSDQNFDVRVVQDFCPIYPITLPSAVLDGLSVGATINQLPRGTGPGNFSWLSWGGATNAPTLAASLQPPGDSYTYRNPDNSADQVLNIDDFAQGATGSMNAAAVREALDRLKQEDILLPAWSERRGQGSRFDYRVQRFVRVRLLDYQLTGQGWLSFEYKGEGQCYNTPPVAQPQRLTTPEDVALPLQLQGSDVDGQALSFTVLSAPAHGRLEGTAPNLTYVPDADFNGEDAFEFSVFDGIDESEPARIEILVTPINDAPIAQAQALETAEDTPLALVLEGSDPEGSALSFRVLRGPLHGSLQGSPPALVYQPAPDFHGVDSFEFVVNDGELDSAPTTVRITVTPVNDAPTAQPQQLSTPMGVALPITLTGTDPDGDALGFRVVQAPANGSLSGTGAALVYTPQAGFRGEDGFDFLANDGQLDSAPARIRIEVIGGNEPPRIVSAPVTAVNEGSAYAYDVDAIDPDGDVLTYALRRAPQGASIVDATGEIDWRAATQFVQGVRAQNVSCRIPSEAAPLDPVVRWHWDMPTVHPIYADVMMSPLVVQTTDDNGDGLIDSSDAPDIAIVSYTGRDLNGRGILRVIDGRNGAELAASDPQHWVDAYSQLAAGDIDGDGEVDFIGVRGGDGAVHAFNRDLSLKWTRTQTATRLGWSIGGASLADLDGDGSTEIVFGNAVLNADGTLRWKGGARFIGSNHDGYGGALSVAADILPTPGLEVIAGPSVYSADGVLQWSYPGIGDGTVAVADIDGDSSPEIVVVGVGRFVVLSATGELLHGPIALPSGRGGPPTLGDMDGDGRLEIGIAGRSGYYAFQANGVLRWSVPIVDNSSNLTGSTIFDFDGDGRVEVVNADEFTLRVIDGASGAVRWSIPNASGTAAEYPVVADVDSDGSADILLVSNQYYGGTQRGVRMVSSQSRRWAPTRSIWNQHAYHVDNINDDGSIPTAPSRSWLTHNTFRLNTFQDRNALGLPDLSLFDLRLDEGLSGGVSVEVVNRGLAPTLMPTQVQLFNGSLDNGELLGTLEVPPLAAGEARSLSLPVADPASFRETLSARVDLDGRVEECNEENNSTYAVLFDLRASDPSGLFDAQRFTVSVENVNEAPQLQTTNLPPAGVNQDYRYRLQALDPDVGDGLRFEVTGAPAGLSVEPVSGELRWRPIATQTGTFTFTVRVVDLGGLQDEADLRISVSENRPPVIVSTPPSTATVGLEYRYTVVATDADGDALGFAFIESPLGMQIDTLTGELTWNPAESQAGVYQVELRVTDSRGAYVQQRYLLNVVVPPNIAPEIVSEPSSTASPNVLYSYLIDATDADGDPISFSLIAAPIGMTLDTQTGQIRWIPSADQIGVQRVLLRAEDDRGGFAVQEFNINVISGGQNRPPSVSSVPGFIAAVGHPYVYAISARDPDDDPLMYSLITSPAGMSIDALGRIAWTPASTGSFAVRVRVSDLDAWVEQSWSIAVSDGLPPNTSPVISSTPPSAASVGLLYSYLVNAEDADGDTLSFSLVSAPAGMTLNPLNGLVQWMPTSMQVGANVVRINVSDARGGSAAQDFAVVVSAVGAGNLPPSITSLPGFGGKVGVRYEYALIAEDPDGDALSYSLSDAPAGMQIGSDGRITWTPAAAGSVPVRVRVRDALAWVEQSWTINVVAADVPLQAQVSVSPNPAQAGAPITINVSSSGAAAAITSSATLNGQPLALDPDGSTTINAPTQPGNYVLVVTVSDGYDTVQNSTTVSVANAGGSVPPTVSILSPREGLDDDVLVVTERLPVRASVNDDDLRSWVLVLVERGARSGEFIPVANGSNTFSDTAIGTLDPTLLQNGQYALLLQAEDLSGNTVSDSVALSVEGEMKIGHFSISFEDVSVPVAGIPVSVTRTYDTRVRHKRQDFGQGWSLDYQNVRVQESRTPGFGWALRTYPSGPLGLIPNYCVESALGNVVSIVLGDGRVEKFKVKASPACNQAIPLLDINFVFEPTDGARGRLETINPVGGRLVNGSIADLADPSLIADPDNYRYIDPQGREYRVDQGFGLREIFEREGGNRVTFDRNGITHSNGFALQFTRDAQDRITRITGPGGIDLSYAYSSAGDLASVEDAEDNRTRFEYQSGHYLRDIIDPRGVRVSRNEYDADGRLVAVIDADGHRVEFSRDIDGRAEQRRDRNGRTTTYVYNTRGDILSETNAAGETVTRTYDDVGNTLSETDALGRTRRWTYDNLGNVLTETDPLGGVTRSAFGVFNQLQTVTDPLGVVSLRQSFRNTTVQGVPIYPGPLVSLTDATGGVTGMGYDPGSGELTSLTDASGANTRYEYDANGFKTAEVDALGTRTTYVNDAQGRLLEERRSRTRADGSTQTLVTRYTLDANGNVVATEHPDGSISTAVFDANDKPIESCDPLNRCTLTTYDNRGNVVRVDYPDGTHEASSFDPNGNLIAHTDRGGRTTRHLYDEANRLIEVIHPDATPADDGDNPRSRKAYDDAGQLIAETDENGNTTEYRYDAVGRLVRTLLPAVDGQVAEIVVEYDLAGRKIRETDPLGAVTRYTYDAAGRLLSTEAPCGVGRAERHRPHRVRRGRPQDRRDRCQRSHHALRLRRPGPAHRGRPAEPGHRRQPGLGQRQQPGRRHADHPLRLRRSRQQDPPDRRRRPRDALGVRRPGPRDRAHPAGR